VTEKGWEVRPWLKSIHMKGEQMNYRWLSIALGVCLVVMSGLWAQEKQQKTFPATKVIYWPVPGSDVVAPGHVGPWNHPDSIEAVQAAPKQHRVLFENDRIRLLEVTLLPGEREPLHGHKYPSVFTFDAVQPALNDHTPDGKSLDIKRGLTDNEFPACLAMGPQEPHAAKVIDTFPQHFYRLELKKTYGKDIENVHWN
jgi:hypothetical protein